MTKPLPSLFAPFACAVFFAFNAAAATDPLFQRQWSLRNDGTQTVSVEHDDLHTTLQKGKPGIDVGYPDARIELSRRSLAPVTVAVIDFGVDPTHPDLAGRIAPDGWNFVDQSDKMYDDEGHGTHVSGIIAANADNGIGISGIAPASVKILPLKILSPAFENFSYNGKFISEYAADAIRYATAHGAGVINMSLSWPKLVDSQNARDAVAAAIQKGVVVVVSAGNDHKDSPSYPCSYPGVICVGAITNTGELAAFSNYGGAVDLLAPGDEIVSSIPLSIESQNLRIPGYEALSGTSQAAPIVAGIAAALKSAYPAISADEVRARLFASGRERAANLSLYGLVSYPGALLATPTPVFVPDFKSLETVTLDERAPSLSGELTVRNLWAPARNVNLKLWINGALAGETTLPSLAAGSVASLPWKFAVSDPAMDSKLKFQLQISSPSGGSVQLEHAVVASRMITGIPNQRRIAVPPSLALARDWLGKDMFGHRFSYLQPVQTYGRDYGYPVYYRVAGSTPAGIRVQIVDTAKLSTGALPAPEEFDVPNVQNISQVLRVDVLLNGRPGYVVTGLGKTTSTFFQFYFVGADLKPLWPQGAAWQIFPADAVQAKNILRHYDAPGSWIKKGAILVPAFFSIGQLPDPDNFNGLDPRHYNSGRHLFYLFKDSAKAPVGPNQIAVLRAADNADFYRAHVLGKLVNPLPQSEHDQNSGKLTFLMAEGEDSSAAVSLVEAPSADRLAIRSTPTPWNFTSAVGLFLPALNLGAPDRSGVYLTFTDAQRGSLTWVDANGSYLSQTPFSQNAPIDHLIGLEGAYEMANQDRFWIAETQFSLIGYYQDRSGNTAQDTLPIDRDSSLSGKAFSDLFKPTIVNTGGRQLPGLLVDSTLIRGNLLSVALWNPDRRRLEKPLKYSFQLPTGCLQLTPAKLRNDPASLAIPLLCDEAAAGLALRFVPLSD